MLCRTQRVTKRQFDEVMKKGRVVHSPLFLLRTFELGNLSKNPMPAKVASVAPVKIAKTAVARNKMRRKLYEAIKKISPIIKSSTTSIVFAKEPAMKAKGADIQAGVKEVFVKAGLLR